MLPPPRPSSPRGDARQQLRDADRKKDEFLAVLSHELRTPLTPIRNSVAILERAGSDADQAVRARALIRRQTEHLAGLVDDLLEVTRLSLGRIELRRERHDLAELVRRACDDDRALFAQRGIALRVHLPDHAVWVDADALRIAQLVGNLLQNAAKFTPEGGAADVTVAEVDGLAELRVRDDGAGMDRAMLDRLFQPFAQAERTLARTRGRLGLGLALAKGIVDLHGGTVRAHSAGEGRGSEFAVSLPLAAPPQAVPDAAPAAPRPRRVLVIEDNVDAGDSLAELLALEGQDVRVARDGRSGLAAARTLAPELVLCDIGLPDLSGFEVAKALRADAALRGCRLVALTGYARDDDVRRAREAGFDAHLAKPPSIEQLLALLASDET